MDIMEEKTKYLIIGFAVGIALGVAVTFLLVNSWIIRPFGSREFLRPDNFTNFTRNFTRGMV